ncbi:MAG: acyl-CoA desaturase [bacterium]|nr:acyl-CoA desaturase [bacterium]
MKNPAMKNPEDKFNFIESIPFFLLHLSVLLVFYVGFSWLAFGICIALYYVRMFAITAGFHRYFSHRSFETSRFFAWILAFLGTMSAQRGPLWWAAHHRHHHKYSDTEEDIHSPGIKGVLHAHLGWIYVEKYQKTNLKLIPDMAKYRELLWLDNYHYIAPVTFGILVAILGYFIESATAGAVSCGQVFVWGFCVSTVLLYHGTFAVNTWAHIFGSRRFETEDQSRNSFLLALITLGEGWHNNHHRYPGSERQGFYWWELDISHYILKFLSWFGIVWNLRTPPERILAEGRQNKALVPQTDF